LVLATIITASLSGPARGENLSQDCVRWNKLFYRSLDIAKKRGEWAIPETLPDIIRGMEASCGWDMSKTMRLVRKSLAEKKAWENSQQTRLRQPMPPPLRDVPQSEPKDFFMDCVTDRIAGIMDTMCSGMQF
jgi:hypothetical protein